MGSRSGCGVMAVAFGKECGGVLELLTFPLRWFHGVGVEAGVYGV